MPRGVEGWQDKARRRVGARSSSPPRKVVPSPAESHEEAAVAAEGEVDGGRQAGHAPASAVPAQSGPSRACTKSGTVKTPPQPKRQTQERMQLRQVAVRVREGLAVALERAKPGQRQREVICQTGIRAASMIRKAKCERATTASVEEQTQRQQEQPVLPEFDQVGHELRPGDRPQLTRAARSQPRARPSRPPATTSAEVRAVRRCCCLAQFYVLLCRLLVGLAYCSSSTSRPLPRWCRPCGRLARAASRSRH